jgi:hypothetical protein
VELVIELLDEHRRDALAEPATMLPLGDPLLIRHPL